MIDSGLNASRARRAYAAALRPSLLTSLPLARRHHQSPGPQMTAPNGRAAHPAIGGRPSGST